MSRRRNHGISLLENVGTNESPVFKRPVMLTPWNFSHHETTPCAVDWDGDGRLDLICGGESAFFFFYFHRDFLERPIALARPGHIWTLWCQAPKCPSSALGAAGG